MKDNVRRLLLFLITVSIGILIVMIDASIDVIIAGTVLAGFCALLITGAVKVAELRPSKLLDSLRKGSDRDDKEKADAEGMESSSAQESASPRLGLDVSGMLGTLTSSVRDAITHIRTPESEKKKEIEQIDAMLSQTVDTSTTSKGAGSSSGGSSSSSIDPLSALEDLDFDSLKDLDLGAKTASEPEFGPDAFSPPPGVDTSTVSDILDAHHSEFTDIDMDQSEDSGIPESFSGLSDVSVLDTDLSELNDLDLDEIEIEVEGEDVEEEIGLDEPVLEEDDPDEPIEQPEENFDMVSFATGGMVDDDLIAAFKTDVKKKKFVEDISLVRELRGEKYDARDLASEIEDIIAMLK